MVPSCHCSLSMATSQVQNAASGVGWPIGGPIMAEWEEGSAVKATLLRSSTLEWTLVGTRGCREPYHFSGILCQHICWERCV